jgi:hypothetical protein
MKKAVGVLEFHADNQSDLAPRKPTIPEGNNLGPLF